MGYTITRTVEKPWAETVEATRAALGEQGFGVLTEIDLQATLKAKLDADIPPLVILGACRPPLAKRAVEIDPAIAALLPCNVVVRDAGEGRTVVEAFDPDAMGKLAETEELGEVATDARARLEAALESLG